jgi:uncharacterized integral membrane protein (TIGR00698 family)
MSNLTTKLPGAALSILIALVAYLAQQLESQLIGYAIIEALVIAILLGMLFRNVFGLNKAFSPGISFAAKEILEFAVVLLGASVNFVALFKEGAPLFVAIVCAVILALAVSTFVGRALGLSAKLSTLIAVGNSICGNSAIAAVAPVIKAEPDDVASSIAFTAVLGVIVVLTLPSLIPILQFTPYQYGVLAGMSVYAVPQVVAAAAQVSDLSLRVATSVKLVRVLMMGPVVLFYSLKQHANKGAKLNFSKLVPSFIIGFIALAVLRTVGVVPESIGKQLSDIGKLIMIVSMAALGLSVDVKSIRKAGPRVTLTVIASLVVLIVVSILFIQAFGIRGA